MVYYNTLKSFHSFAINVYAQQIITVHSETELLVAWQQAKLKNHSVLILGGGSNVLFLENYSGTVLLNRIKGITIHEDSNSWNIHIGAGENWHHLVTTCLQRNIPGLENLALIPGYVGSAPIQNIGAYGVEFKQFCSYIDVLKLDNGVKYRLSVDECQFGYRNSIFKNDFRENYAIIAVALRLIKNWSPTLNYHYLSHLNANKVTPYQIYHTICMIRRSILPNPVFQGNAGSFFKNPIIGACLAKKLLTYYPKIPYYYQEDGNIKLAAGWLIEQCGLKGYQLGGAAVYHKQALILINANNATSQDIITLAKYVRKKVWNHFSIWLEPEVTFINSNSIVYNTESII